MKKNKPNPILLKYIPHGLNHEIMKPLDEKDPNLVQFKKNIFKNK